MRFVNIAFFLIFIHGICAQVKDNFDDGDITNNPVWSGAVNNFRIDENKSLRLNAAEAGQSFIYTPLMYPDSFTMEIDVILEFSPSASNYARLYFMLDNIDLTKAKGYFLNLGENGSSDALRLYKLENGGSLQLGAGKEGLLSIDPVKVKIKVNYRQGGTITVNADYDNNGVYESRYEVQNSEINVNQAKYFGIECTYSATRKDKFVYDNFEIKSIERDITPPGIKMVEVINDHQIKIQFDEIPDKTESQKLQNYVVTDLGNPVLLETDSLTPTNIVLSFDNKFFSGKNYLLTINTIEDESDNVAHNLTSTFTYIGSPKIGDIVISEILFDPYVNQQDYVEIYNSSDETFELKGIMIKNFNNNQVKEITSSYLIKSKEYLAISTDTLSVIKTYTPNNNAHFFKNELPAFNNDIGNVTLMLADGTLLDSFNYSYKYHLFINDDKSTEGVSLEKIKLERFGNKRANWKSSEKAVKYGTPGYANSNTMDIKAPTLIRYEVQGDNQLLLAFDDVLYQNSVENIYNYKNQILGFPMSAVFYNLNTNVIVLTYAKAFEANIDYEIEIKNIKDKNENEMSPITFRFSYGKRPETGDLAISEILFNPYSDGEDFIELYNISNHNIQLKGVTIINTDNHQEKEILEYYVLEPKRQVAITFDIESQKRIYKNPDTARFLLNALPALNADNGKIIIENEEGRMLDSFSYNENMHFLLFDKEDVKGVSLEKLLLRPFENSRSNWHSPSKSSNYATPGYRNSNDVVIKNTEESFLINKSTFSPNGDGQDDLLVLTYKLDTPGYIANIEVYSSAGYKVKNLAKNELLGTSGIITWDGTNDSGEIENVGIYILKGSIYSETGVVNYFIKECVLANFID